jgi:hypothetical protein
MRNMSGGDDDDVDDETRNVGNGVSPMAVCSS